MSKKKSSISLKKWLEGNKIFFELISMILVSFMAIIVSIKANSIAEDQRDIMVKENLPKLDIISFQSQDDSTGYPTTFWRIYNRGGQLYDLRVEDISFVRATLQTNHSYTEKLIPIYDYLDIRHEITGETTELMYILTNRVNKTENLRLQNEFYRQGYMEIETYLKISFKNFKKQKQVVYYSLNSEEESTQKLWDHLKEIRERKKQVDIRSLTLTKIKQIK